MNFFSAELPQLLKTTHCSSQSQSHSATDGQSVSQWVFVSSPIWGSRQGIYYCLTVTVLFYVGHPLWREDGPVFCICYWPLPAQSFSGPSPLVLATVFYRLRIETFLFVASYDSQGHGGDIRPRLHTRYNSQLTIRSVYIAPARIAQKTSSIVACSVVAGKITFPHSCSLATAVVLSPVYTTVTCQWAYTSQ
jgi:hypothetical protein